MKIKSFFFLAMVLPFLSSIATNNENEWRTIFYRKGPEGLRAHLSLARKSITPKEKTWHLRRILSGNDQKLIQEAKKILATYARSGVERITNDQSELKFSLKILEKAPFADENIALWWSAYHLIRFKKLSIPDWFLSLCFKEKLLPCLHVSKKLRRLKVGTFGSCLSVRTAYALGDLYLEDIEAFNHSFQITCCRLDFLLDTVIEGNFKIGLSDLKGKMKTPGLHLHQLAECRLGRSFSPDHKFMWNLPQSVYESESSFEERLGESGHDLIILDNFPELKFQCARLKSNPEKYLFITPKDAQDFEKDFQLEPKPPVSFFIDQYNQFFQHLHTLFPKARIVFLHFPANHMNEKLAARGQEFLDLMTFPDFVHSFYVPTTDEDTTDYAVHFKPWYYEVLAQKIYEAILTPKE